MYANTLNIIDNIGRTEVLAELYPSQYKALLAFCGTDTLITIRLETDQAKKLYKELGRYIGLEENPENYRTLYTGENYGNPNIANYAIVEKEQEQQKRP